MLTNKLIRLFLLSYLLLNSNYAVSDATNCNNTDTSFNCVKYVRTIDGDTVVFDLHDVPLYFGKHAHIRINGIDAPEIHSHNTCEKKAALNAKNRVDQLLKDAKTINLTDIGKEKYGRILANIIADGNNIGAILLQEKLAYVYNGGTKKKLNWCGEK